jgi:hypothetical protein
MQEILSNGLHPISINIGQLTSSNMNMIDIILVVIIYALVKRKSDGRMIVCPMTIYLLAWMPWDSWSTHELFGSTIRKILFHLSKVSIPIVIRLLIVLQLGVINFCSKYVILILFVGLSLITMWINYLMISITPMCQLCVDFSGVRYDPGEMRLNVSVPIRKCTSISQCFSSIKSASDAMGFIWILMTATFVVILLLINKYDYKFTRSHWTQKASIGALFFSFSALCMVNPTSDHLFHGLLHNLNDSISSETQLINYVIMSLFSFCLKNLIDIDKWDMHTD